MYKRQNVVHYNNYRLSDHATVFQAEIHAITQAGKYLLQLNKKIRYLKIFSDSQAALLAIDKVHISSTMVRDAVCTLEELANKINNTKLLWIKAHIGHEGNEIADRQAKLGAERTQITCVTPKPWGLIKNLIAEKITEEWKNRWEHIQKHDATKFFWKFPDKNKSRGILNLCRADLSILIKAITGQNFLAYHQSKIDIEVSKVCRLCEEDEETFIHLITECPSLEMTRRDIFLDKTMGQDHTWSIRRVLRFIQYPIIMQMLSHKNGALLKELVEIDHNYTLTSDSN